MKEFDDLDVAVSNLGNTIARKLRLRQIAQSLLMVISKFTRK